MDLLYVIMTISITTTIGLQKIAAAIANNSPLVLSYVSFGDGNGNPVTPTENTTQLVHQVYSKAVNSVHINTQNPNWVNIDVTIPPSVGGFTLREWIVYDQNDDAIFVGNLEAQPKPVTANGSAIDLFIRIIAAVENTSAITMLIDPNVTMATQIWVISNFQSLSFHENHEQLEGLLGGDNNGHFHLKNTELERVQSPFFLSKAVVNANYEIPQGYNAGCVGLKVANGVTVTVPNGSNLKVL